MLRIRNSEHESTKYFYCVIWVKFKGIAKTDTVLKKIPQTILVFSFFMIIHIFGTLSLVIYFIINNLLFLGGMLSYNILFFKC